jgi:hypothetical protein
MNAISPAPVRRLSWHETAEALSEYVKATGFLPRQCGATSSREQWLGRWLGNQRRAAKGYDDKGNSWSAERQATLDSLVPDWKDRNVRPSTRPRETGAWLDRADAVVAFHARYGRFPSTSEGAGRYERRLARWLGNQRQARKGKGTTAWDELRLAHLDARLPDWEGGGLKHNRAN